MYPLTIKVFQGLQECLSKSPCAHLEVHLWKPCSSMFLWVLHKPNANSRRKHSVRTAVENTRDEVYREQSAPLPPGEYTAVYGVWSIYYVCMLLQHVPQCGLGGLSWSGYWGNQDLKITYCTKSTGLAAYG